MKFRTLALAALLAGSAMVSAQVTPEQAARERSFDASIGSAEQDAWLKQMSSALNHVRSAQNKANAEFIRDQFKAWGWDVRIEQFDVLYPTPISTTLQLVAPAAIKLGGQEPTVAEDATSASLAGWRGLKPKPAQEQGAIDHYSSRLDTARAILD